MKKDIPYDLSHLAINALLINNTYNETTYLSQLNDRILNNDLMIKGLSHLPGSVSRYDNLTSKEMKEKTQLFATDVTKRAEKDGAVVTLLYFSGFGTRCDYDFADTFLCGTDYTTRYRDLHPYRLMADYLYPLSKLKGVHMLVLDVCDITKSNEYPFVMPQLPLRFHALFTTNNREWQNNDTSLTKRWCDMWSTSQSIERKGRCVRGSEPQKYIINEHSTLLNQFIF